MSIFRKAKVIDFDVINHQCRGDKLQRTEKEYKTIDKTDLKDYPEKESKKILSAVFRNKRDNLWVKRDLMLEYFKKNF